MTKLLTRQKRLHQNLTFHETKYINETVSIYNFYNKKILFKKQLHKESKLTRKDSMNILSDFEKLVDKN